MSDVIAEGLKLSSQIRDSVERCDGQIIPLMARWQATFDFEKVAELLKMIAVLRIELSDLREVLQNSQRLLAHYRDAAQSRR